MHTLVEGGRIELFGQNIRGDSIKFESNFFSKLFVIKEK